MRAKAEAIATASSAVAEADALRSLLSKATKDREAAVRHAQAQEEDLDAEKAKLQHKVDELEEERVSLQVASACHGHLCPLARQLG